MNHHILPATRAEAVACGSPQYFTGKPCKHGHTAPRKTYNWACQECQILNTSKVDAPKYLHHAYYNMVKRCTLPTHPKYQHYGGRGIKVCERWLGPEGFVNFVNDMGERPSPEYSLDRERVNEGYHPGNCRWATDKTQRLNKRKVRSLSGFTHEEIAEHIMGWPEHLRTALIEALS